MAAEQFAETSQNNIQVFKCPIAKCCISAVIGEKTHWTYALQPMQDWRYGKASNITMIRR